MEKDTYKTEVIFRRFNQGKEVIALFPAEAGSYVPETCQSYMHRGQHGSASVALSSTTKPASLNEQDVTELYRELEQRGYNLSVVTRFTAKHRAARLAELEKLR